MLHNKKAERINALRSSFGFRPFCLPSAGVTAAEASATMKASAFTAAETAALASCSRHRPRMESSPLGTASGVNAMRVRTAGGVVRARAPGAHVSRVKGVVEMSAVERSPVH